MIERARIEVAKFRGAGEWERWWLLVVFAKMVGDVYGQFKGVGRCGRRLSRLL